MVKISNELVKVDPIGNKVKNPTPPYERQKCECLNGGQKAYQNYQNFKLILNLFPMRSTLSK